MNDQDVIDATTAFLPAYGAPSIKEYVVFGQQRGAGSLKWLILDTLPGKGTTLLLSELVLSASPYTSDDACEECSYEMSDVSELISELQYDIFTSAERKYLACEPTIPSALMLERCLPRDGDRVAYPSPVAVAQGLALSADGAVPYWTATAGKNLSSNVFCQGDGDLNALGKRSDELCGIRLLIELIVDPRIYSRKHAFAAPESYLDLCAGEVPF